MLRNILEKYYHFAAIVISVSLVFPWLKVENIVMNDAIGTENSVNISYTYPSFFNIMFEAAADVLKGRLSVIEAIMAALFCIFFSLLVLQVIAVVQKRYNIIYSSALALFTLSLLLLLFIVFNSNTVIYIGYYLFLMIQTALILFSYTHQIHAADTTR